MVEDKAHDRDENKLLPCASNHVHLSLIGDDLKTVAAMPNALMLLRVHS